MSDAGSSRIDDIKARLKEAIGTAEGDIDSDAVMSRIRETVGKAGSDVDTDALMARVRDAVGKAEEKVDAAQLRQWVDDVDREKLKGWLDEAKTMATGAAAIVETQGERLAERAPGAWDKVLGVAKEKIGDFIGDEGVAREGELQHLKGDIEERFATADPAETQAKDTIDTVKDKTGERAG